jgi:hypothetical protein
MTLPNKIKRIFYTVVLINILTTSVTLFVGFRLLYNDLMLRNDNLVSQIVDTYISSLNQEIEYKAKALSDMPALPILVVLNIDNKWDDLFADFYEENKLSSVSIFSEKVLYSGSFRGKEIHTHVSEYQRNFMEIVSLSGESIHTYEIVDNRIYFLSIIPIKTSAYVKINGEGYSNEVVGSIAVKWYLHEDLSRINRLRDIASSQDVAIGTDKYPFILKTDGFKSNIFNQRVRLYDYYLKDYFYIYIYNGVYKINLAIYYVIFIGICFVIGLGTISITWAIKSKEIEADLNKIVGNS